MGQRAYVLKHNHFKRWSYLYGRYYDQRIAEPTAAQTAAQHNCVRALQAAAADAA
jgi:hypothetical protein